MKALEYELGRPISDDKLVVMDSDRSQAAKATKTFGLTIGIGSATQDLGVDYAAARLNLRATFRIKRNAPLNSND